MKRKDKYNHSKEAFCCSAAFIANIMLVIETNYITF